MRGGSRRVSTTAMLDVKVITNEFAISTDNIEPDLAVTVAPVVMKPWNNSFRVDVTMPQKLHGLA